MNEPVSRISTESKKKDHEKWETATVGADQRDTTGKAEIAVSAHIVMNFGSGQNQRKNTSTLVSTHRAETPGVLQIIRSPILSKKEKIDSFRKSKKKTTDLANRTPKDEFQEQLKEIDSQYFDSPAINFQNQLDEYP